mmetsp:Transcript_26175/g.52154  ORF Transcript_26175/g.52154 Transcript_26175/m.52154 type:complete len:524 (+) Transcript_26175:76-1647(+)
MHSKKEPLCISRHKSVSRFLKNTKRKKKQPKQISFTFDKMMKAVFFVSLLLYAIGTIMAHLSSEKNIESHDQVVEGINIKARKSIRKVRKSDYESTSFFQSIRNEKYMNISHPVTGAVMHVPDFWKASKLSAILSIIRSGQHQHLYKTTGLVKNEEEYVMTKSAAQSVGSINEWGLRTIFVLIISEDNNVCRQSMEQLFSRARYPERLRVGVVERRTVGDVPCNIPLKSCDDDSLRVICSFKNNIDVYNLEAEHSASRAFAFHIGQRMYRGEYFVFQLDSPVIFSNHWDKDIVQQFDKTRNEMAVITNQMSKFSNSEVISVSSSKLNTKRTVMCNVRYNSTFHYFMLDKQPQTKPLKRNRASLQPFWSSSFSFSRGHFLLNVPYDPHLPYLPAGVEDISISVRGFTYGYDFYSPGKDVCFRRNLNFTFLKADKASQKKSISQMMEVSGLLQNKATDYEKNYVLMYGLGKVRNIDTFLNTFMVHYTQKKNADKLCKFVKSGKMHKEFLKELKSDNMGIDYTRIS